MNHYWKMSTFFHYKNYSKNNLTIKINVFIKFSLIYLLKNKNILIFLFFRRYINFCLDIYVKLLYYYKNEYNYKCIGGKL